MKLELKLIVAFLTGLISISPISAATSGTAFPAAGFQQVSLNDDRAKAEQSSQQYENYHDRVDEYIHQVEQICAEAHEQRTDIEAKIARIRLELPSMPADKQKAAKQTLTSLNSWLNAESNLASAAAANIDICQRWLAHCKNISNLDSYNAAEEEQTMADEQRKIEQTQQIIASEQRKQQDSQYWAGLNDYDYGGYGYGGYGNGYNGYGYGGNGRYREYNGYHNSGSSHISYGHSGGGHSGGGHGGGGHR